MRLWSIHPRYLDWMGLGAVWREGLLAQAVIEGRTKGWRNHPQLNRFKEHLDPLGAIGFYLIAVREEAAYRGYSYDVSKIRHHVAVVEKAPITRGQLLYEFRLLFNRTKIRSPVWHSKLSEKEEPEPHPLFFIREGEPERWETSYWRDISASKESSTYCDRNTES
jgi:hypothetical protein